MSLIANIKSYSDPALDLLWNKISLGFKDEFGSEIYNKWLIKLQLHSYIEQEVIMSVPSKFLRDWIKREYLDANILGGKTIKEIWLEENPKLKNIALIYLEDESEKIAISKQIAENNQQNIVINLSKYDNIFALGIELNPKFTFENFVVGKSNQLAFAMAQLVAKVEGININSKISATDVNPLFLYGGVGLGKTHLAQSIAWHIKENTKNSKVIYLSAERFMHQFVQSLRSNDIMDFKERFRGVDLLIIDDLQFVAGKDGTQQELLHTLSSLIENNKQIVLICDKSPGDLGNIDEKLKSRIGGGIVVDFTCPDYQTRLEILKSKSKNLDVEIAPEVLDLLANKINSNIRDLEGALKKMIANHILTGEKIDLMGARNLLKDLFRTNSNGATIEQIQKKISAYFNIKIIDLNSANRSRAFARPRQIGMYLAKNLTNKTLPEIGREFGGKNHATVIHAIKKIEQLIIADANFAGEVHDIEKEIKN